MEASGTVPEILYEDADVIAVWKPAGEVVHPSHGHYQDTLANRLQSYFQGRGEHVTIRSIGRLDADTAGILIFAKNQFAAQRLWRQRENGQFHKTYAAWCEGVFAKEAYREEQSICAPIGAMAGELQKMCVTDSGRPAKTYYQVRIQRDTEAFLILRLDTGRTHQIRVHMAWTGHPLLGDPLYGNGIPGRTRADLTAWEGRVLSPPVPCMPDRLRGGDTWLRNNDRQVCRYAYDRSASHRNVRISVSMRTGCIVRPEHILFC